MHPVLSWIQGITIKRINELGTGNIETMIKIENNYLETVNDILNDQNWNLSWTGGIICYK